MPWRRSFDRPVPNEISSNTIFSAQTFRSRTARITRAIRTDRSAIAGRYNYKNLSIHAIQISTSEAHRPPWSSRLDSVTPKPGASGDSRSMRLTSGHSVGRLRVNEPFVRVSVFAGGRKLGHSDKLLGRAAARPRASAEQWSDGRTIQVKRLKALRRCSRAISNACISTDVAVLLTRGSLSRGAVSS
jgi:hypothetical protein